MRLYEAMFLVESSRAKNDWKGVDAEIKGLVEKNGGQVLNCQLWEERKLNYEIAHQKRGTYVLAHFNAPPEALSRIERGAQLSEVILRALITRDLDGPQFVPPAKEVPAGVFRSSTRPGYGDGARPARPAEGARERQAAPPVRATGPGGEEDEEEEETSPSPSHPQS